MRTLNPAMKFVTLLCVTFVLAFRYNPVLNLAVFVLCMAALLVSKVRLKTLGLLMLPILLAATGMFFTGYRFSADASMPVAAADFLISDSRVWNGGGSGEPGVGLCGRRFPVYSDHGSDFDGQVL